MTLIRLLRYKLTVANLSEKKVIGTLMIVTTMILLLEGYQLFSSKKASGRRFLLIVYLSVYSDTVRTNILRVLGIAVKGFEVLIVYFLLYIGGGMLNRILFYDNPLDKIQTDSWIYFDYDFSSTARSIFTQFIGDPGLGFPGVFASALALGKGKGLMLFLQTWLYKFVFQALIMTHLFFYYTSFYDEAIDKLKSQCVLWSTMAELYVKFEKVVPVKITEYVLKKYATDQDHDFSMDEGFQKMKATIYQHQVKEFFTKQLEDKWRNDTL